MSWIGETFAGMKRIIQLDGDVARLRQAVEKSDTIVLDQEKRLIRIETMIDVGRAGGDCLRVEDYRALSRPTVRI